MFDIFNRYSNECRAGYGFKYGHTTYYVNSSLHAYAIVKSYVFNKDIPEHIIRGGYGEHMKRIIYDINDSDIVDKSTVRWMHIKDCVLYEVNKQKFYKNQECRELLISTGNRDITGSNLNIYRSRDQRIMGTILTRIRDELTSGQDNAVTTDDNCKHFTAIDCEDNHIDRTGPSTNETYTEAIDKSRYYNVPPLVSINS